MGVGKTEAGGLNVGVGETEAGGLNVGVEETEAGGVNVGEGETGVADEVLVVDDVPCVHGRDILR